MKSDLDRIMEESNINALLVRGPAMHNPSMSYFLGLHHVSRGYLLKMRDAEPVHFHDPMEREEAAASGLRTESLYDYGNMEFLEQTGGDVNLTNTMLLERIFTDFKVSGRVAVYGYAELGPAYSTLKLLQERMPAIELVGEDFNRSVLMQARLTKDEQEIERIRAMGKITVAVVADVAGFLTSHAVKDGYLVDRSGNRLTVGSVKQKINLWLAMRGAENPEGTIFAIGRDAGIPHSAGADEDEIPVGVPIVFDIFPCEAGGGYFYDFTRTWCLGYAPDEVAKLHADVLDVFNAVSKSLRSDTLCREHQKQTCELFEAMGHPTVLSNPKTTEGYVHSLAHGLGLNVHESPSFTNIEGNQDRLLPGMVFTVEPGLYYPERGMGARIEDTVWIRPDGRVETLVDFSKELVLKMPAM
ncbi:MAG: M24 family metallopeptidase [Anaerolineales bacterium]|jgi:Xaa-Pro aminopeptidase